MPYKIVHRSSGKWCVVNSQSGDERGCHNSRQQALAQLRALYVHVPDARKDIELEDLLDEMPEMLEKATKKESDGEHPSSHYLVVEDAQSPLTWHLRVRNAAGDLDHRLMGAAWAALHGGYRGNTYGGPNKETAIAKLRRLYASEDMPVPGEGKALDDDMDEKQYPYLSEAVLAPSGPTSFDEFDQMMTAQEQADKIWNLNGVFRRIIDNIVYSMDVKDKVAALSSAVEDYAGRLKQLSSDTVDEMKAAMGFKKAQVKQENGMDFYAKDYAFVPNPELPSTWKLRLSESPGKITVAQLGRAAAALSPGGFRGNRVEIPASALSAIKRRIRYEYQKLGVPPAKIPPSVREDTSKQGFMVWKDGEIYRWLAVYSNYFRDDDFPAEILSQKAHVAFHQAVEDGLFDYPELWHWHKPGTRFGKAEHLSYVDGFALAAGTIDKGHEDEAEALMGVPFELGVSHGMPLKWIVRNAADPTVIDFYVSTEISVLPKEAAANKHTGFVLLGHQETDPMPLTAKQRDYFKLILSEDQLASLEKNLQDESEIAAQVEGRDSKETSDPPAETEPPAGVPVTSEGVAEAVAAVMEPLVKVMSGLNERLNGLEAQLKELQVSETTRIAKAAESTPRASIEELIRQRVFGNVEAKVAKDAPLASQAPQETEPLKEPISGVGWLDGIIRGGTTG